MIERGEKMLNEEKKKRIDKMLQELLVLDDEHIEKVEIYIKAAEMIDVGRNKSQHHETPVAS